jgi:hypothetical protein
MLIKDDIDRRIQSCKLMLLTIQERPYSMLSAIEYRAYSIELNELMQIKRLDNTEDKR